MRLVELIYVMFLLRNICKETQNSACVCVYHVRCDEAGALLITGLHPDSLRTGYPAGGTRVVGTGTVTVPFLIPANTSGYLDPGYPGTRGTRQLRLTEPPIRYYTCSPFPTPKSLDLLSFFCSGRHRFLRDLANGCRLTIMSAFQ